MSEESMTSILLGVVAGVITASVLFIIRRLFVDSFLPWYRQLFYRGIHISGKWFSYSAHAQKLVLELRQDCEKLTGKATAVLDMSDGVDVGVDTIRTFDIEGTISERFVMISLTHTEKSRIGVASLLLQIEGDGTILRGCSSGYNPVLSKIDSHQKAFFRDEMRAQREQPASEIPIERLKRALELVPEAFATDISPADVDAALQESRQSEQAPGGDSGRRADAPPGAPQGRR